MILIPKHFYFIPLIVFLPIYSYKPNPSFASILVDSARIRAVIGQSTPYTPSFNSGLLTGLDPLSYPAPLSVQDLSNDTSVSFSMSFLPGSIASFKYYFLPQGSSALDSITAAAADPDYFVFLNSAAVPYGATGYIRVIDYNGNWYRHDMNHFAAVKYTWDITPNCWHIIKPPRGSMKLINTLAARPDFIKNMGKKQLLSIYRNSTFIDYSQQNNFSDLGLSEAFLVFLRERFTLEDTLQSVFLDSAFKPISHPLKPGWNLIANPFLFPVAIANLVTSDSTSPLFSIQDNSDSSNTYYALHSSTLSASDSIMPFIGYWVYSFAPSNSITFYPYTAPQGAALAKGSRVIGSRAAPWSRAMPWWTLAISNRFTTAYAGERRTLAAFGSPPGATASVFTDKNLSFNLKPRNSQGNTFELSMQRGQEHSFSLKGDSLNEKNILYIADNGASYEFPAGKHFAFPAGDYYKSFIISGTQDYVAKKINEIKILYPNDFYANQNYPNPFNPVTRIQYGIPIKLRAAKSFISIHNIKGQRIFHQDIPSIPGHHIFTWNGIAASGQLVSSGVYFARINIGTNHKTIKMVELK
jgi:hypothetical protein